jgi:tryptophan 2,3-dioxygenase
MDKEQFFKMIQQQGNSDYEAYLRTNELLSCQKKIEELCNQDELQFQIVHQIEELLLKLLAYTLVNIMEHIQENRPFRALTNFQRAHRIQRRLIALIDLLETMSPADYQAIRLHLGAGSGITSPGFKNLHKIMPELWNVFKAHYLDDKHTTIEQIYSTVYTHDESYVMAEALAELDELHHRFFKRHIDLISRTIGEGSKSLKGRPVECLRAHADQHLFPELWKIRSEMTDKWGQQYGVVRPSITE